MPRKKKETAEKESLKKFPPVRKEKTERQLMCKLTSPELEKYGHEMALQQIEAGTIEGNLGALAKEIKGKIAQCKARVNTIAGILSSGSESRSVECEITFDYKEKKVKTLRKDTGEVIEDRDMRNDETQMQFASSETEEDKAE